MIKQNLRSIALWIYEQLRLPVILFCLFYWAGFSFYRGVISANKSQQLFDGKAIVIMSVDLRKDDE